MLTVLIPTYKRNNNLTRLIDSINNHLKVPHKIIISDNDKDNDISFKQKNILYFKQDRNLGPRENIKFTLCKYLEVSKEKSHCILISDDDFFEKDFFLSIDPNVDLYKINCKVKDDNGRYIGKLISRINNFLFGKGYFIDENRVLTGNILSYKLVDRYINLTVHKLINDAWYQMQIWSYLSRKYVLLNSNSLIHTVNNETFWGHFQKNEMVFQRLHIYNFLINKYDDKSIFVTKLLYLSRSKKFSRMFPYNYLVIVINIIQKIERKLSWV